MVWYFSKFSSRFKKKDVLTNSLLLTAKGLECIHPSVSFPLIRTDTTLKVCISVWEADVKILVTPPTADEYLLNMLCVYAELCFTKFDASHFRQMPQGPLRPFKSLLLALAHILGSSPKFRTNDMCIGSYGLDNSGFITTTIVKQILVAVSSLVGNKCVQKL